MKRKITMKTVPRVSGQPLSNSDCNRTHSTGKLRRSVWIAAVITTVGFGFGFWSIGQQLGLPSQATAHAPESGIEPPMTPERALAILAFEKPVEFEAEARKHMTLEELQQEQIAVFAITQPAAYAREFEPFKDNDRREAERLAREAVLNPVRHSGSVDDLKEEARRRKERGEPIDPILEPISRAESAPATPVDPRVPRK